MPGIEITWKDNTCKDTEKENTCKDTEKEKSYCIYCGKPLVEGVDAYISGCICGVHNAKMCLECYGPDTDKYLDGDYYAYKPNHTVDPEKTPLIDKKVKDALWCVLTAFLFWVAVAVYFVYIR